MPTTNARFPRASCMRARPPSFALRRPECKPAARVHGWYTTMRPAHRRLVPQTGSTRRSPSPCALESGRRLRCWDRPPRAGSPSGLLVMGVARSRSWGVAKAVWASSQSASRCQAGRLGRRAPSGAFASFASVVCPGEHPVRGCTSLSLRAERHERLAGAPGLLCQGLRHVELHHLLRGGQCCSRQVCSCRSAASFAARRWRGGSRGRRLTSTSAKILGWKTSLFHRGRRIHGPLVFARAGAGAAALRGGEAFFRQRLLRSVRRAQCSSSFKEHARGVAAAPGTPRVRGSVACARAGWGGTWNPCGDFRVRLRRACNRRCRHTSDAAEGQQIRDRWNRVPRAPSGHPNTTARTAASKSRSEARNVTARRFRA